MEDPVNDLEKKDAYNAESFLELSAIALTELYRLGPGIGFVSGPISTGGYGIAENLRIFNLVVQYLKGEGRKIFDPIPFEDTIFRLRIAWRERTGATRYCKGVLQEFYAPLIQSGLVREGYFIPGYRTSVGARWERCALRHSGARITDLDPSLIEHLR